MHLTGPHCDSRPGPGQPPSIRPRPMPDSRSPSYPRRSSFSWCLCRPYVLLAPPIASPAKPNPPWVFLARWLLLPLLPWPLQPLRPLPALSMLPLAARPLPLLQLHERPQPNSQLARAPSHLVLAQGQVRAAALISVPCFSTMVLASSFLAVRAVARTAQARRAARLLELLCVSWSVEVLTASRKTCSILPLRKLEKKPTEK